MSAPLDEHNDTDEGSLDALLPAPGGREMLDKCHLPPLSCNLL